MVGGLSRPFAGLVAVAVAGVWALSASAVTPAPTTNVTAYTMAGALLPADPQLHVGERLRLVVTGFAPGAAVAVRLVGATGQATAFADPDGVLRYGYGVSTRARAGDYLLTFAGAPPPNPPDQLSPSTGGISTEGESNLRVTVPTIGLFPFRVAARGSPSSSRPPSSAPPRSAPTTPAGAHANGSTAPGGPGRTGGNVVPPLIVAAVALTSGAIAVLLGRRGKQS